MHKEPLIEGLNTDLANEYQAIITYITYASTVTGIYREEMKEFFYARGSRRTAPCRVLGE